MNLSTKSLRIRKKGMSVLLSSVLALNTIAMVNVKANGTSPTDAKALRSNITTKAVAFINSQKKENGSYGDSSLVNDTAEAMLALRAAGETVPEKTVKWLNDAAQNDNTDIAARLSAASGKYEFLSEMSTKQNPDGGFGLYPEYSSDVLDSVLVLEAVNETNYSADNISGIAVCNFLVNSVNKDGGFSYTKAGDSDDILTSMVVYNVGRYLTANNYDLSVLDSSVSYIEKNISDDYTDTGIRKTLWKYLAKQALSVEADYISIVNELDKAEKADGSFAEDIETTSAAIRLLNGIDLENKLNVLSFETFLSSNKASTGKSSTISGITSIGYTTNIDATLDLKITVYSSEAAVYENSSRVICKADENLIKVDSCEFKLAEPNGSEVYLLAELFDNDKLLRAQRINIDLDSTDLKSSTAITDIMVELNKHTVLNDTASEIEVGYDLLYATNIEESAQIKAVITKEGREICSKNENVSLAPEQNHVKRSMPIKLDELVVGTYDVAVSCYYKDDEIVRGIASLEVKEQPVITEKTENNTDTQFVVNWFGPILSDYYVYAGNETVINAGAEINYYSNDVFNGKIELKVLSDENVITETSFDTVIEKGEIKYVLNLPEFPVYRSEDQLSFTVKNVGEYVVNARLLDSDGKLVKEGSCALKVVDRPKQDLILNSSISSEKSDMIDLSWNDISNDAESYNYQLYRKTDDGKWEPRSIWNEEEHIMVLNIYPYMPYLDEWMTETISDTETPAGKGIFDIDSVHISEFKEAPEKYLYNEDGSWKYDIICFGFADSNGRYDINDSVISVVQKFIDSGRGVLFGHDTIEQSNFNYFAEQTGLLLGPQIYNQTTEASVVEVGTITNYPWVIRGTLSIPSAHTSGQYVYDGIEWITLNNQKNKYPGTEYMDGFYLCTKNNLGMIQTGHSTGQATDDERKVLANTLFYLYQISQQTTAKDASFYDESAPDTPTVISSKTENGKAVISVSSADNATEYEYYISANPADDKSESVLSNVKKHTALSGLAGFIVKFYPNSDPDKEFAKKFKMNGDMLEVVPADKDGKAVLEATPDDFSHPQYIHIFAVDNANNVSEEYIVPFADSDIKTSIKTDKRRYAYGDKVKITADTVSTTFGRTADMSITVYDEFDNKVTELVSEKAKVLEPDVSSASSTEWEIPVETSGRFKAVISWNNEEDVLAEAEASFKIENEHSISNFIASDKKTYAVNDPINLTGDIYNNSKAMTENDIVLNVKLYNSTNREIMGFEHNVGSLNPDAFADHSDAIAPGKLKDGNYFAKAVVTQDNIEISSDTAEFTVSSEPVFSGRLELSPADGKGKADFSVMNTGTIDADEAEITVSVYEVSTNKLVHTYSYPASIKAGENVNDKTEFNLDNSYDGDYSAVLSVSFNGTSTELDYDGFKQIKKASETKTTSTTTTAALKTDSPKTGDNGIPVYMWLISILSVAGIIVLKRIGGEENE